MRSSRISRSAFSASVLALVVAALGWADWQLLTLPVETPPPVPAQPASGDASAVSDPADHVAEVPRLASFAVIGERPLFVAGRRYKLAIATEPPPAAAAGDPELHLSGIMLQDGEARALIAVAGAPSEWVAEGESVGGWTVRRIRAGAAELVSEAQSITVDLYGSPKSTP